MVLKPKERLPSQRVERDNAVLAEWSNIDDNGDDTGLLERAIHENDSVSTLYLLSC